MYVESMIINLKLPLTALLQFSYSNLNLYSYRRTCMLFNNSLFCQKLVYDCDAV